MCRINENLTKLLLVLFSSRFVYATEECTNSLSFPDGFSIGVGTSAYQIEGAWNANDKSESVWDHFVHNNPNKIINQTTGDVSCDSYHKYKEDIKFIKDMGLNHYRFSISWPRILPTGYAHVVSKDGLRYYHDLLTELERNNITPFVTIYHWDHPEALQKLGGWTNEVMVDLFGDYARVVFREFGERVKLFTTINEPYAICRDGYITGSQAPGYQLGKAAEYLCGHNILKAHARAYHIYDDEFRAKQAGKIGIALPCKYHFLKKQEDLAARERAYEFDCGLFAHPIFSADGDYPEIVKQKVAEKSRLEGRTRSKLPEFTKEWIQYIKGTADYYGLNHYTSFVVESATSNQSLTEENDADVVYSSDPKWPSSSSSWLKVVPEGLRFVLNRIKEKYNNPPIYILENGVSDNGTLSDNERISYLESYMRQMLIAINRDNCDVRAYTIWSLLDNFEWNQGYSEHFGLISVDFDDDNRPRRSKLSTEWIKAVSASRQISLDSLMQCERR